MLSREVLHEATVMDVSSISVYNAAQKTLSVEECSLCHQMYSITRRALYAAPVVYALTFKGQLCKCFSKRFTAESVTKSKV